MGVCNWYTKKFGDSAYVVFRVLVGLGFLLHGGQKLFAWFGGPGGGGEAVALVSMVGLAGVIEFFGGLAVLLGFFTRLAATGSALLMLVAFFMAHFPKGWNPLLNNGEAAFLYFAAFLALTVFGNGKFSLEKKLLKKETF
tara:strand:- start:159 stop:578 length:420 start_codon:yes stop_codon:yes gene_type:complete